MRGPAEAGPLVSCVLSALLPRVALRGGRPPTPHDGTPARRSGQVSQPRLPPPLPPTSANNLLEASDGRALIWQLARHNVPANRRKLQLVMTGR